MSHTKKQPAIPLKLPPTAASANPRVSSSNPVIVKSLKEFRASGSGTSTPLTSPGTNAAIILPAMLSHKINPFGYADIILPYRAICVALFNSLSDPATILRYAGNIFAIMRGECNFEAGLSNGQIPGSSNKSDLNVKYAKSAYGLLQFLPSTWRNQLSNTTMVEAARGVLFANDAFRRAAERHHWTQDTLPYYPWEGRWGPGAVASTATQALPSYLFVKGASVYRKPWIQDSAGKWALRDGGGARWARYKPWFDSLSSNEQEYAITLFNHYVGIGGFTHPSYRNMSNNATEEFLLKDIKKRVSTQYQWSVDLQKDPDFKAFVLSTPLSTAIGSGDPITGVDLTYVKADDYLFIGYGGGKRAHFSIPFSLSTVDLRFTYPTGTAPSRLFETALLTNNIPLIIRACASRVVPLELEIQGNTLLQGQTHVCHIRVRFYTTASSLAILTDWIDRGIISQHVIYGLDLLPLRASESVFAELRLTPKLAINEVVY